jgi:hypothetical protein
MLEATAVIAIILLIAREFLALAASPRTKRMARLAGWGAAPFLLGFGVLFAGRVLAYLGAA